MAAMSAAHVEPKASATEHTCAAATLAYRSARSLVGSRRREGACEQLLRNKQLHNPEQHTRTFYLNGTSLLCQAHFFEAPYRGVPKLRPGTSLTPSLN